MASAGLAETDRTFRQVHLDSQAVREWPDQADQFPGFRFVYPLLPAVEHNVIHLDVRYGAIAVDVLHGVPPGEGLEMQAEAGSSAGESSVRNSTNAMRCRRAGDLCPLSYHPSGSGCFADCMAIDGQPLTLGQTEAFGGYAVNELHWTY